ncbi:zinc ribbon domain-containing protein YjdM [Aestuariibacter salexigens]|uniref:zinc ribbon domain-containing protein YjdM n=1 Tax=Aestuariibacter salexigens TaxID=226010 RepID=UPI00047A4428|nr:zinc ribbon domain-containing protein YjdM [Aestuariibacter salexigens]
MSSLPPCPKCQSQYVYQDANLFICPECGFEWTDADQQSASEQGITDANGNLLADGDTVTVIKDLKIKGSSSVVKVGTKVKNIRLLDADHSKDGHNIDCKIDGLGAMKLTSKYVKKT